MPVAATPATHATNAVAGPVPDPRSARSPAPPTRSRRRLSSSTVALLAVVGLEVAAIGVLGLHLTSGSDQATTVSSTSTYAPPMHLPAGTAFVRSRVVAPNSLAVTHWIHSERGVYSVRIKVPRVSGPALPATSVSDLVVVSDGHLAPEASLPSGHGPKTYIVPPGRHIYVSYVLTGAIQLRGSPTGQALARVTALDVSTPPVPVTTIIHSVLGARILALACSQDRPSAVPRPCGRAMPVGWRVRLRDVHRRDRVMARMSLS